MRSIGRTLPAGLARDVALVCLADAVVGLSYGAVSVSGGLDPWVPVAMSLLVFAGASQFLFTGIVTAGGSLVAAVAAALLVNGRHLPFGLAIRDALGSGRRRRLLGIHLMIDESVAFASARTDPAHRRAAYWTCGVSLFVTWNVAVAVGVGAGRAVHDTDALGLDAAFPAVLLALVLPSLRDASLRAAGAHRAALAGAAIALVTTPFLPAGLPILLALLGLLATRHTPAEKPTTRRAGHDTDPGTAP